MKTKYMPSVDAANHIDKETGEVMQPMYRLGYPQQYRFNASTGVFNFRGEDALTKAGESFTLRPLGLRVFRGELFTPADQDPQEKEWAELFFLNEANQVGAIMFHGWSVDNFRKIDNQLYYDQKSITDIVLSMKPVQKQNKATGSKYYILEFSYEIAGEELVSTQNGCLEQLEGPLFRLETLKDDQELLIAENYGTTQKVLTEEKK
jgi:hypothetical protein